jgi:DNA gyrase subunit A
MTPLQSTFSINMLTLVEGEPRLLSLKRALQLFLKHRQEIITRRTRYELDQAKNRAHILEGLRIALDNLDEVIAIIRKSRSVETARNNLRKQFKLSVVQATAILDMPLRRLAALERKKIETEYKELLKRIQHLQGLLKTPKKILGVIKEELRELKKSFDTPRRTMIVDQAANKDRPIITADLVPDEAAVVAVSQSGHLCRWPVDEGLEPGRGRRKNALKIALPAQTRDTLYLFTTAGRALILPMHQVPDGSEPGDGLSLAESGLVSSEMVVAGLTLSNGDEESGYLFLVSRAGRVKRVALKDLKAARGGDTVVMGFDNGDTLLGAFTTPGDGEVVLASAQGQAIRFKEDEVRPMGLPAAGVWGMKLAKGDELVGAGLVKSRGDLVLVTQQGIGKRTGLDQFPTQGRYGQGVVAFKLTKTSGPVAVADTVNASDRVMLVSEKGNNKTVYARALPKLGRSSQGKEVMAIRGKDQISNLITLVS